MTEIYSCTFFLLIQSITSFFLWNSQHGGWWVGGGCYDGSAESLPTNPGQFRGQGSRPHRRPFPAVRSAEWTAHIVLLSVILQKKIQELKRNQPTVQVPLLENFTKKPSAFLKINPQSNNAGIRKFANKILTFHKINPPFCPLSWCFQKKPSDFN